MYSVPYIFTKLIWLTLIAEPTYKLVCVPYACVVELSIQLIHKHQNAGMLEYLEKKQTCKLKLEIYCINLFSSKFEINVHQKHVH